MASEREKRRYPRAPFETEVHIEFSDIDELMSEYSANLSLGGMFINRVTPLPIGTSFRFKLRAGENKAVIAGKAKVTWVRTSDASDTEKAGMGVRFTEIDEHSRALIFEIVDRYIQESNGEPFRLDKD